VPGNSSERVALSRQPFSNAYSIYSFHCVLRGSLLLSLPSGRLVKVVLLGVGLGGPGPGAGRAAVSTRRGSGRAGASAPGNAPVGDQPDGNHGQHQCRKHQWPPPPQLARWAPTRPEPQPPARGGPR
jgi:hypothetical protein